MIYVWNIDGFLTDLEYGCEQKRIRKILQKTNRRTMDFIRHMRRSDKGNYLESGEVRGNMQMALSDERRKTLN